MLTIANKGRYVVKKCKKHVYVICEGSLSFKSKYRQPSLHATLIGNHFARNRMYCKCIHMYVPNYYLRYMSLPVDIEIINVHSLPQIAWTTDLWRMDSVTFFGKYFYGCFQQFQHQFYLQSVYKPHFTHEFFCLGHLGSSGQ